MATHLPDGASRRRFVEESVLSVFFGWGYREVITPIFEYLDILSAGLSEDLLRKSYKFVDRESGRLMILRPDITPQIARMVAGNLFDEPRPLRLCYYGNVFRHQEAHAGREQESFQVGGELVGPDSPSADSEILSIAVECLRSLGLRKFSISLGHAGFLKGILSGLPAGTEGPILEAISKRDISGIDALLDGNKSLKPFHEILRRIPYLFGGEDVLSEAERWVGKLASLEAREAVSDLRQVYRKVCLSGYQDVILVDLGEIRDRNYYTGLFFEVFAENVGYPLGRGGRYNHLIGRFGKECPSTGFALEVETLVRVMEKQRVYSEGEGLDFLIADYSDTGEQGIPLHRMLREKGYRAAMEWMERDPEEAVLYSKANDVRQLVVLGLPELEDDEILLFDIPNGRKMKRKKEEILTQLQKVNRDESRRRRAS